MATRTKDRRASNPKNGRTKGRAHMYESSCASGGSLVVQWEEDRIGRTGVPSRYFVRGIRTPNGWLFDERDGWEISSFPVPQSRQSACIRQALEIIRKAADDVRRPARRAAPEVGNFHDNVTVLAEARSKFSEGHYDDAVYLLTFLRGHIAGSPDPKSKRLMPEVDELLTRAVREESALQGARATARQDGHTGAEKTWRGIGAGFLIQRDSGHRLKRRLIEATLLVTTFASAMGLLVHEIGAAMPDLAPSMVIRNVLAASILSMALFLIRSRGS